MRTSIKQFVQTCSKTLPLQEPIYEFGSLQVAGQEGFADLRPFFPNMEYIGADMEYGLGVDVILNLHKIDLPDNSVGTVISCDTLEHVEFPRRAMSEIYRILKPGGTCILTSVMDWEIHGYPNDYWRFTPSGFESLLHQFKVMYVDYNGNPKKPHTVVGVGVKEWNNSMFVKLLQYYSEEWKSVNDFPLSGKLLSPVVKCKKFVERKLS